MKAEARLGAKRENLSLTPGFSPVKTQPVKIPTASAVSSATRNC
jgi:hypothetical protein